MNLKIIRKNITELNANDKSTIDKFVEDNDGLIFHETTFNEIVANNFKTKLSYALAYGNEDLIGVCPIHIIKKGLLKINYSNLSHCEVPYGGWIYDKNKISIRILMASTKIKLNESLNYWSTIQPNNNDYLNSGITEMVRFNTVILDLSTTIDDIFNKSLSSKQRNKIRRAQKLGVVIENIPLSNFDGFIKLSSQLKLKIGSPLRASSYYKNVFEFYSKKKKAVCLAAKYNGQYISSMILLANNNYTIAWIAGRQTDISNNLYQNEYLWWESIIWAKKYGSKYLDLCGLDELKLPQLARIKLSFSKNIVPFYLIVKKTLLFRVINKIQNVFIN